MTIVLPLPHPRLSPNSCPRGFRGIMARAHLTKVHRQRAKLVTLEAMGMLKGKPVPSFTGYTLEFRHAMRRRRDDDNLAASCKAYRDGIADALGIDDFRLRLLAPPSQHIDRAQPCLRVTLHVWPFP